MWRSWTSGRTLTAVAAICLAIASGCCTAPSSGIDPTGEHIFAAPPPCATADRANERYHDQPLGPVSWDDVSVDIEPAETVASVGSEVVLKAGVCGPDGYLRTNRRLEWSIDPGGVGQFVAVGETGVVDVLLGDFNRPRKITNTFAIGSTLRTNTRLNRGACIEEENTHVLRGQGWISLTSPIEGTSHVTVFAPEVYRWDCRLKSAMVHWVDAQWRFPPPAINPAGSKHAFTTTVLRQSNQAPCENWRVRYEIVEGPPAGFMPDGATAIEVPTNAAGQACVEIFQKEPRHGTNKVGIQVIRPGELPGANGRRLVVGRGTTMKTWTAAALAVKKVGPASAGLGATFSYRISVSNPGDLPAKDVVATDSVPDGLTYVGSNPPAAVAGRQLQWQLGELGARQCRTIDVSFRAEKPGSVANCCEVVAAGGLKVSDCATTTIAAATVAAPPAAPPAAGAGLQFDITGPTDAVVGSSVTHILTIRNPGPMPATNLMIVVRLDPGLEHPSANRNNAIEQPLKDAIAPGAAKPIKMTMGVKRPGRLCYTVEVSGPNAAAASRQVCINATVPTVAGQGAAAPITPPLQPPPKPAIKLNTTGPNQVLAGETVLLTTDVINTGPQPLQNLRVVAAWDPALDPRRATRKLAREGDTLVWTIESLAPGASSQYEIEYKCQTPGKACSRMSVATADGTKAAEDETCLEIQRPAGPPPTTTSATKPAAPTSENLDVSVVGLTQPVNAGNPLTYEIRLTNRGQTPYEQIKVTVKLPDSMVPDRLGTVGPAGVRADIQGKTVSFDPVAKLGPGPSLVYDVRARTLRPGKYQVSVEVTAAGLPPITREETTDVNERAR